MSTVTSCTPLDAQTLNHDHEINTIYFIWNGRGILVYIRQDKCDFLISICIHASSKLMVPHFKSLLWQTEKENNGRKVSLQIISSILNIYVLLDQRYEIIAFPFEFRKDYILWL
jgi:hypothetical protein